MIKFTRSLINSFKFLNQSKDQVIFFSEGSHDWEHMKNIILNLTLLKKRKIIYLTCDPNDKGLINLNLNEKCVCFCISSFSLINLIFRNIQAKVIFMTMTDLGTFYLKKSHYKYVKYAYLFHSINSTHAVYLENAFLNYDYIFTVGPFHKEELLKYFKNKGKNIPTLVDHGSEKLDEIISDSRINEKNKKEFKTDLSKIVIGFSWGKNSISEDFNFLSTLISKLVELNYQVVLRPHAMTLRRIPDYFKKIANALPALDNVIFDDSPNQKFTILNSKFLITDWSGLSFEYAFGLNRPVLFFDTNQKIRNPNWQKLNLPRLEDIIRNKIGIVISPSNLGNLTKEIKKLNNFSNNRLLSKNFVYNVGNATTKACDYIEQEFYE